jgi:hypothetical protein
VLAGPHSSDDTSKGFSRVSARCAYFASTVRSSLPEHSCTLLTVQCILDAPAYMQTWHAYAIDACRYHGGLHKKNALNVGLRHNGAANIWFKFLTVDQFYPD